VVLELKIKNPMLNLRVFESRGFSLSVIMRNVAMMGLYSGTFLLPLYLQNVKGLSALDAGLVLLPSALLMALCALVVGKLYNRVDPRILMVFGVVLMSTGSFLLSNLSTTTPNIYMIIYMILRQVGSAFATNTVTLVGMGSIRKEDAGAGSSVQNWITQCVSSLSVAVFASLLITQVSKHTADLAASGAMTKLGETLGAATAYVGGVNDAFFVSSIIMVAVLPICFFLKRPASPETPAHP
jgi:MFS family permease